MSSTRTIIRGSASGCTDIVTEHFTYEWVIKKFKLLSKEKKEIYSPIFRTITNGAKWRLKIYPHGRDEKAADYVSIYLNLHSQNPGTTKMEVQADFSILPSEISREFSDIQKYENGEAYGFSQIIKRSNLLELCGCDDTVTIRCTMIIPMETVTEAIDSTQCMEQTFDLQEGQLTHAFRLLFTEPKLSDVTVIAGTRRFPAHKLVLATRSPVFSVMFENKETQENRTNEVNIEKMEPDVVEAMLEFLYTDEVKNLEELAYGLLEAADKYDIQRLRTMCEKVLYKTLNEENAAEILILADLHRSYKLKERVMEFMHDHLSDVVKTDSYKEIKDPELLSEFITSMGSRQEAQ